MSTEGVNPFACDPDEVDSELRVTRSKGEQSRKVNGRLRFKGMRADRSPIWIVNPKDEKYLWMNPSGSKRRRGKVIRSTKTQGPIITMDMKGN